MRPSRLGDGVRGWSREWEPALALSEQQEENKELLGGGTPHNGRRAGVNYAVGNECSCGYAPVRTRERHLKGPSFVNLKVTAKEVGRPDVRRAQTYRNA